MAIANKSLKAGIWNSVQRFTMNVPISLVRNCFYEYPYKLIAELFLQVYTYKHDTVWSESCSTEIGH
jgi:hypothetical protein